MAKKRNQNYYFDMFVESANYSCKCAQSLLEFVQKYPDNVEDIKDEILKIHKIEHDADLHFHDLYSQLMKEFLPPIDREDILMLGQYIDDLTDSIESVSQRFFMLNIQQMRPDFEEFVKLVTLSCHELKEALEEFSHFKKSTLLPKKLRNVNDIEEEGDAYYQDAVHNLFVESNDPMQIIKWREIYSRLEDCLDNASRIADSMNGVILKNS